MRWLTYFSEILPSVNKRAGEFTRCGVLVEGQKAGAEVKCQHFGLMQVHSLFYHLSRFSFCCCSLGKWSWAV